MRYDCQFLLIPGCVCIRTHGEASLTGFARLIEEVTGSSDWKPGTGLLVDNRRLKPGKLSVVEMDRIKDLLKEKQKILGNGRCAFLVDNQVGFGLSRMYGLVGCETIHSAIEIFHSEEDALEWLAGNKDGPRSAV